MIIAVIFGGRSCEHNISVITGIQAMREMSVKHEIVPVYIDNAGVFWTGEELKQIKSYKSGAKPKKKRVMFMPSDNRLFWAKNAKPFKKIDAALLCNHGLNGEDGTLQGYLELAGIPYSGSGTRASADGMDKITMKKLFAFHGLPVLPYKYVTYEQYKNSLYSFVEEIKAELDFPLIVKPANLGSSIGIGIAHGFEELFSCIETAFMWDNSILIENALTDFIELNCAVLGSGTDLTASEIEQPVGWKDFLTFDDKYTRKYKGTGRLFPAPISAELKEQIQDYAKEAFSSLGCAGVARVDFLLKDDKVYINEINTIPGALSNYLFPFKFSDLIDRLIDIALNEKAKKGRLKYSFNPSFSIGGGSKGKVKDK